MSPEQIVLVEETLAAVDMRDLTHDFYRRLFDLEPALAAMFTTDPPVQEARFAAELSEIVASIRSLDSFAARVQALGARHRTYGVRAAHYRIMGRALLAALAAARGPAWTPEAAEAWAVAYDLVAETMQQGALLIPGPERD
jgi:hemoglobin-like flavoprotein